jgi:purine-binding chemotaxis protein CheW
MTQQAGNRSSGTTISVLVFELQNSHFAVPTEQVVEILWLPELTPVEEVPGYVEGVFDLRGVIVPVVNLDLRFGHSHVPLKTSDIVVVIDDGEHRLGVIVNQVLSVEEDALVLSVDGVAACFGDTLVVGEVEVDGRIVMLLDHQRFLLGTPLSLGELEDGGHPTFCPDAGEEEHIIYRSRAEALRGEQETYETTGLNAYAVAVLSGEFYGLELGLVREFATVGEVAPVPCTPPHIMGNMNLRGDIVTIVDVSGLLGMPPEDLRRVERVIIFEHDGMLVGVPTDTVDDVVYVDSSQLRKLPTAVKRSGEEYLKGEIPFRERMVTVLDLHNLLHCDALVVDEAIS